jgi:hypothetical protein
MAANSASENSNLLLEAFGCSDLPKPALASVKPGFLSPNRSDQPSLKTKQDPYMHQSRSVRAGRAA